MMKSILTLVDGSDYAVPVCEYAAWMAQSAGVKADLLHVLKKPEALGDHSGVIRLGARSKLLEELATLDAERSKMLLTHGHAILEDAVKIFADAGANEPVQNLRHGDLVEAMTALPAEIVVVGKRGEHADFATGHLGTNLERVITAANAPVLVVNRAYRAVKRVLVAYDGGASAKKLIAFLSANPDLVGDEIVLAHIGETDAKLKADLAKVEADLANTGAKVRTVNKSGEVGEALAKIIAEEAIDMLAMGTNEHSRLRKFFIHPSHNGLIKAVKVPVLIMN